MNQPIQTDELIIDCKDIYLREYRLEDLKKLQEITWQPEVYEFLPGWNATIEDRACGSPNMKFLRISVLNKLWWREETSEIYAYVWLSYSKKMMSL